MPFKNLRSEAAKASDRRYRYSLKAKFRSLKFEAGRQEHDLTLTQDEYILLMQGAKCHYCDELLNSRGYGLDRKDRNQGYHLANVVPCCTACNYLKGVLETKFSPNQIAKLSTIIQRIRAMIWK